MEKVVIFGAGKIGKSCFYNPNRRFEIIAVMDNNPAIIGQLFEQKIPIIGVSEYMEKYREYDIVITMVAHKDIEEQLKELGIDNYRIAADIYNKVDVSTDIEICHDNWVTYLQGLFNKKGMEILEIGSRNVTGANLRNKFSEASYTGFDYYPGENVDVVGDAHKLSQYFDRKFDLIFSSAVFEHLAMPWKVSVEITKLLKLHGCVFIETHYSYSSHQRPWHFFQFSENALDALFPEKFGMRCLKKGCCNLLEGRFSEYASEYLAGRKVNGLYCHSEYLGEKVEEFEDLSWDNIGLVDVAKSTEYPKPVK
ncbi:MAG: methyltransferase domain-containing protein [Lachnospiraceae bacterium]|nr:methyltransferase domain-containing protein [Lachnospiraceae bacterium]